MLLIIVGIIASLALAYWIGNSWLVRGAVFAALATGVACYGVIGSPTMSDKPLHKRLDELRDLNPEEISGEQWIAMLQERAKIEPDSPMPHKFIGDILMQEGKPDEAVRAYQSALRKDNTFVEALTPMADALVAVEGGRVNEQAREIYVAAFSANTRDVKAAFMPGMHFWLNGDRDGARAWWAEAQSLMPAGSPEASELSSQVELLQQAMANVARQREEAAKNAETE